MKISGIYKGTVISDEELHQIEVFAKKNRLKIFIEKDFYNQRTNIYIFLRNIIYDMEGIDIDNNYIIKEMMNEFHFIRINGSDKYCIERSIENLLVLTSSVDDNIDLNQQIQEIQRIEDEKENQVIKQNSVEQSNKRGKKSRGKKSKSNSEETKETSDTNTNKTEKRKRGRPKKS